MFRYPRIRLRRNKKTGWSRDLVAQSNLHKSDLIMPLFVIEGHNVIEVISTMKGVFRYSIDKLIDKVQSLFDDGILAIMLFPCISQDIKSPDGSEALNSNNLICRAIAAIKKYIPGMGIIADVALDAYTSHGFDGVLDEDGDVDNDKTIDLLCKQALLLVQSGADAIAPSDMMDGRIGIIRDLLESYDHHHTQIFSYAVKFASNFYSPFRDAIGSKYNLGIRDKKTYFSDYRNAHEAMLEIELDISEGADIIIIKPGMMYLDIIYNAANSFKVPIFAYQVSGEYAMLTNAAEHAIINEKDAVLEVMCCFKRAGATSIITYYADRVINWIC